MARDYIVIGSSPAEENCAQVGSDNYTERARRECKAFINQLRREFGTEPVGATLAVKSFPHDFGYYYEVVCYYDEGCVESIDYAFKLEAESPAKWDVLATVELELEVK